MARIEFDCVEQKMKDLTGFFEFFHCFVEDRGAVVAVGVRTDYIGKPARHKSCGLGITLGDVPRFGLNFHVEANAVLHPRPFAKLFCEGCDFFCVRQKNLKTYPEISVEIGYTERYCRMKASAALKKLTEDAL